MSASEQKLYFLLQLSAHALRKAADAALTQAVNITTAQAAVLTVLENDGPLSQRQIAARLMQRESAVTTMVGRLRSAGYVQRKRSETDARAWVLEATQSGKTALRRAAKPFGEINTLLDECFNENEIQGLARGLSVVVQRLTDESSAQRK